LEQLKVLVGDAEKSFTIADALKAVRMSRTSFYRELIVLKELGYVICSGGNKKKGIEYRISNWNDFSQLKEKTDVLDTQLKEIQASFPAGKEVSHKNPIRIPKVEKSLKAIRNKDLRASDG
jgi:hypothetical protein